MKKKRTDPNVDDYDFNTFIIRILTDILWKDSRVAFFCLLH